MRKDAAKMHHDRKVRMLNYFSTPQAATDAAVELDIPLQSVQKYLREMKASGHVQVIEDPTIFPYGIGRKYKATGLPLIEPTIGAKYNSGFTFMGVRF